MRWSAARELVLAGIAAVTVASCGAAGAAMDDGPSTTTPSAGMPYSLYTHCGVYEARIGDTYYLADDPLDDGQGNPPPGWGNPFQDGTMTFPAPGVAVFSDRLGHVVRFHARPGATSFLRLCS